MNERQTYALAHPLDQAHGIPNLERLRSIESVRRDEFLAVILAVDR